ncbi:MAG: PhoH family protein, partial [Pseudomonadota bacterium]
MPIKTRTPFTKMDADPGTMDETLVEFADNRILIELCGQFDRNLTFLEKSFDVVIMRRGNQIALHGVLEARVEAKQALEAIYQRLEQGRSFEQGDLEALVRMGQFPADPTPEEPALQLDMFPGGRLEIRTKKKTIEPRTATQRRYAMELFQRELVFGIGPAGTGKTFLAVACAVQALDLEQVRRIVLVRPAVEAGERLGFLPGDMSQKVDPYLRPIYDALYDMMGFERVARLMERNV